MSLSASSTLRPSSSPAAFASQAPLPPPPSLGSLINASNLEHYLSSLHSRLQSQEHTITQLQSTLSSSLSLTSFSSFSSTLLAHVEAQEKKIADLQAAVDSLTQQQPTVASHSALLAQHSHQLSHSASKDELSSALSSLQSTLSSSLTDLRGATPSLTSFHQLQSSLHMLLTQMGHMQTLLGDKVDKAELPLLEGVEERVKGMMDGVEGVERRVAVLESDVKDAKKALDTKEDKEDADGRLRSIEDELAEKVGSDWLQENVVDELRAVQDDLLRFAAHDETMRRIIEEQQQLHSTFTSHHTRVQSVSTDVSSTQQRLDDLDARVRDKVDAATLERCRREDGKHVDRLLHEMAARTTHDFKVHATYLADLRAQVAEQTTSASHHSDKLNVALKFIDWFTETKLQMV